MSLPLPPAVYSLRPATNADGEAVREVIFAALRAHGMEPSPEDTNLDLNDIKQHDVSFGGSFDALIRNASIQALVPAGLRALSF